MHIHYFRKSIFLILAFLFLNSCKLSDVDARKTPTNALERARKNVEEGKSAGVGTLFGRGGNTNFEFSTSNPMWRASLEILDFIPMATVDYAGGMIISDWYSDNSSNANESIKITIRFLSNEVRSDSLKVVVHKKICQKTLDCKVDLLANSLISQELRSSIIRKAALLEKEGKEKK